MNLKSIQSNSVRTGFLASLLAIASLSGITACSTTSQNQAQAPNNPTTEPSGKQDMMQGGGMNHSMAMDLGPADANYDLRFIDGMAPHHQGAVDMAKEALSKSKRPEIKKLAQEIITSQQKEIEQMKQWKQAWYKQL